MLIETLSTPFRKVLATNATDTSFASKIPTGTEPTNDGVIDLATGGSTSQNALLLVPYGTGGDNDTFAMRVIAWDFIDGSTVTSRLWVPIVLTELTCTMSATVGVANKALVATERFVDTLVLVTGNDDISIDIVSPTADEVAHAVLDVKGFRKVEFSFDMTAAGSTGANCLIKQL